MDTVQKAMWYLFAMGIILILVAYWVGSTNLFNTIFTGVNMLDLTATGRNANGVFGAYPVSLPTK